MLTNIEAPAFIKRPLVAASIQFDSSLIEDKEGFSFPKDIQSASKIRQAEYTAGRYCAREALQQLDPKLKNFILLNTNDRIPEWPPGFCGSITHTSNYAAAVVARKTDALSLGLDSENIFTSEILKDVKSIATNVEVEILSRNFEIETAMTLIFSGKEAVFKALFPITKRWLEFEAVVLSSYFQNRMEFKIASEKLTMTCDFEVTTSMVHTLAVIDPKHATAFSKTT